MRSAGVLRVAVLGTVGLALALTSGCATIMAGGPDHVPISTNPPGATVFVDNMPVGTTPMMVTLNRETSSGMIRLEMAGFQPITVVRAKGINGWFWANLCTGGVIGIVVDLVTGDVKSFDDTPIAIGLTPAFGPAGAPGYPPAGAPGYPPAPQPGYPPGPPPAGYPPPPPGPAPAPPPPPRR
jgi:hypothetical protein